MSVSPPTACASDLGDEIVRLIGQTQYVSEPLYTANPFSVRAMCAATENRNPAHWSEEAAQDILGGLYCPATMLPAWARPELWEPGDAQPLKALQSHFDLKDMLGFAASIVVSYTITFYEPVQINDRLKTRQIVRSIGGLKTTKLGRGRFWTIDMEYLGAASQIVGAEHYEFFGFEKDSA